MKKSLLIILLLPSYVFAELLSVDLICRGEAVIYCEDMSPCGTEPAMEKIKIDTIDSYLERNNISSIDFLKIDVEGNELKVLHGAKNALSKGDIRYIQFEYGGTYIDARIYLKDIFYFLYDYGYSLHKIYPKKIKHVPKYDQSLENFNYQNWLAVKND